MAKVDLFTPLRNKVNKEKDLKENLLSLFDKFLQKANIPTENLRNKLARIRAKIEIDL